jgi:parallel beta-helix repeat protein
MMRTSVCALVAGVALLAVPCASAGPITPPPGPVGSTHKTLTEVEPRTAINAVNTPGDANSLFKITQSGSYYLTGNLTGVSGKHGIEVAASDVTIDLMGFALQATETAMDGVATEGTRSGITIRNGIISGWGQAGIDLEQGGSGSGAIIESVQARQNAVGINVGRSSIVRSCVITGNRVDGMVIDERSVVESCVASENGGVGIVIGDGSVASNCQVWSNESFGLIMRSSSAATNCVANNNGQSGIFASSAGTISGCTTNSNGAHGIQAQFSTIYGCSAMSNQGGGILGGEGSSISGCTVRLNKWHGIYVIESCVVRDNGCFENGDAPDEAGIYALEGDHRIEGNLCVANRRGIWLERSASIFLRNTCSGNDVNWHVAAGNHGLVVSSVPSAGFSGNSGGAPLGATEPDVNFTY